MFLKNVNLKYITFKERLKSNWLVKHDVENIYIDFIENQRVTFCYYYLFFV